MMDTTQEIDAGRRRFMSLCDAVQRCAAVLSSAAALEARSGLEADKVAALAKAVHTDADAAARLFEAAGATISAELMAQVTGCGDELTKVAPKTFGADVRELAARVAKAASEAQQRGLHALCVALSVIGEDAMATPAGAVLHRRQERA
jgi:hypothetical protein